MKVLWDDWGAIESRLRNKRLLICLDFDGTLTPIVERPEDAGLPLNNKALLKELAQDDSIRVVIISGRALSDIKERIGIKNITYAGNHGLEIEGPDIYFDSGIQGMIKESMRLLKEQLSLELTGIHGAWVEDKGLTFSVHYRQVDEHDYSRFKSALERTCEPYLLRQVIKIKEGKKVFEITPFLDWDKGKAVLWLLKKEKLKHRNKTVVAICIGDDRTDQDAFKALGQDHLTVAVGSRELEAAYFLGTTREVTDFLGRILELKGQKK